MGRGRDGAGTVVAAGMPLADPRLPVSGRRAARATAMTATVTHLRLRNYLIETPSVLTHFDHFSISAFRKACDSGSERAVRV